jgi:hydroxymethylbilane synthase
MMGRGDKNPGGIIIGARGSKLALWQAGWVKDNLARINPDLEIAVETIKTEGDARHDLSPGAFGREGIFTAELDRALLDKRIDLAVHSLKDLPTKLGDGLTLAAVTERASIADVFALRGDHAEELGIDADMDAFEVLDKLPKGLVVGTSSLRRIAQLKHYFPRLDFAPMRGNLDTRMKKLGEKQVDAVVVAEAGLKRLGIQPQGHLFIRLLPDWYLPAAGQGALAAESRERDPAREIAAGLDHAESRAAVIAERAAMSALGAGCRVPAGFLGQVNGDTLLVRGVVGSPDGAARIKAEAEGPADDPESLGRRLAKELLEKGAGDLLKEARG